MDFYDNYFNNYPLIGAITFVRNKNILDIECLKTKHVSAKLFYH